MLVLILGLLLILAGCITPHKEVNGQYTKPAKTEERSFFGTNHGFARLERCDGPTKEPWLFWAERDFKNCVLLTKAEQAEWEGDQSRGAGPEVVSAVIIGTSLGTGLAVSGGNAAANAASSSTAKAISKARGHGR